MNTEFEKQLAVCERYRKKTDFWRRIMWWTLIIQVVGWFTSDVISLVGVVVFLVVFIPARVRLHQYGREVDKLGEKVGK